MADKNQKNTLEKAVNSYTPKNSFLEGFKQIFYKFFSYSENQKDSFHSSKNNLIYYNSSLYRTFI